MKENNNKDLVGIIELDNFHERFDQLVQLGVLVPQPVDGKNYKVKFEKKFNTLFSESIKKSWSVCHDLEETLQVNSAVTIHKLHPELNKSDLYSLSHICLFIFLKFYKMTEDNFKKFMAGVDDC